MTFNDDFMELGSLIPRPDGTYLDSNTGNVIDEMGRVYDKEGDLIFDPGTEEYE